mmetsp:Transcript_68222/g.134816  ORF Transcript_68222/g.134816 Transcript_68222/m.134816 type:complete len:522 (-) Transcript_68222:21-1586(-)
MALDSATNAEDTEDEEIWGMLAGCAETMKFDEPPTEECCKASPESVHCACSMGAAVPVHDAKSSAKPDLAAAPPDEPKGGARLPQSDAAAAAADSVGSAPAIAIAALPTTQACRVQNIKAKGSRIPEAITQNVELNMAIDASLPPSHNFEVHKTIWRIQRTSARHLGLQMPEGLQHWATRLADIFRRFAPSVESTTILGDQTFGACCIDDLAARALGVDLLVHYGHSCIVPTDQTTVTTLYVHVEVSVDVAHLVDTIRLNFAPDKRLAFMGSVQFVGGMMQAVKELKLDHFVDDAAPVVPQVKPLGLGETLGCTSPQVDGVDAVVFVCDGRFHLESAMIQNPHVKDGFFRYDPGVHTLTRESFAYKQLHSVRRTAIDEARSAKLVGLILGTLGRQGSSGVLEEVERVLDKRGVQHLTLLLSEVSPERLALFKTVDAWVQVACPRLSLDWGEAYKVPLLTPYEAHVAFGDCSYADVYPMDYYSNRGGPWSNYGAHNGHGGSLGKKFSHLRNPLAIEYEDVAN